MSQKSKAMALGGLVGAVIGATAAWAYVRSQEGQTAADGKTMLRLQAGAPEYVKIGVALLALVRQVVDLLKPA
jgi:hypothetical protein